MEEFLYFKVTGLGKVEEAGDRNASPPKRKKKLLLINHVLLYARIFCVVLIFLGNVCSIQLPFVRNYYGKIKVKESLFLVLVLTEGTSEASLWG